MSDETMPDNFDYGENDCDNFATPSRRRSKTVHQYNTPSTMSSFAAKSCTEVVLTPRGAKKIISQKEIECKLVKKMKNSAEKCPLRDVRVEKGKRLSLVFEPQPLAIMPAEADSDPDPIFQFGIAQRAIYVKTSRDEGFQRPK